MATESPMRMAESGRATNWSSSKDSAMCVPIEEYGSRGIGIAFEGEQISWRPNRHDSESKWSPRQALDNWAENNPAFMSGQKTAVIGRHTSLVDLIQEDFPIPLLLGSADVCVDTSALDSHDIALISKNDSVAMSLSSSTGPDGARSSQNSQIDETNTKTADWRMMCQLLLPLTQIELGRNRKSSSIMGELCCNSIRLHTGTYMPSSNPLTQIFSHLVYAPHYNVGGYALNFTFLLPFVAGYPPHGPDPMPFDATSEVLWTPCNVAATFIVNPFQMQYFEHPFGDAYNASVQYARLPPSNGGGVIAQLPVSPISSPVLPSLSVGGTSHPGWQNGLRYPQGSYRNTGIYPGWQGQRGVKIFDDPKRHSCLEELKSSNAQKFEL
ncbi:hypothetical protein Pint_30785 [Pistacia integerrima]|uniref:Uncharacterized protein n=1 Tax=Pistacia integerrima TaxID=434235 RepID=A0ACC0X0M7_9ROSI|nr:hypothetical protein Pint_30785 [Pistacia integerrima]